MNGSNPSYDLFTGHTQDKNTGINIFHKNLTLAYPHHNFFCRYGIEAPTKHRKGATKDLLNTAKYDKGPDNP